MVPLPGVGACALEIFLRFRVLNNKRDRDIELERERERERERDTELQKMLRFSDIERALIQQQSRV